MSLSYDNSSSDFFNILIVDGKGFGVEEL